MSSQAITSHASVISSRSNNSSSSNIPDSDTPDLLQFAEILYRCTLCHSVPSLSTTKQSFLSHMHSIHLSGDSLHACLWCKLKFGTKQDLREHIETSHPTTISDQQVSKVNEEPKTHHVTSDTKLDQLNNNGLKKEPMVANTEPYWKQETASSCLTPVHRSKRKRSIPVAYRQLPAEQGSSEADDQKEDDSENALDLSLHTSKKHCTQPDQHLADLPKSISSKSVVDSLLPVKLTLAASKGHSCTGTPKPRFVDDIAAGIWSNKSRTVTHPELQSAQPMPKPATVCTTDHRELATDSPDVTTYKCSECNFTYSDYTQYRRHWKESHEHLVEVSTVSEAERFVLIKRHLPDLLEVHPNRCVGRCPLLEKLAPIIQHPTIDQWGASCNRAMREIFPESQAARKGKFKKTYYFGVRFIGDLLSPDTGSESVPSISLPHSHHDNITGMEDGEEDASNSPPLTPPLEQQQQQQQQGLKDNNRDVEKLISVLPGIIHWTGDMDSCVIRDHLMQRLSEILDDPEVLTWGVQCNRAVRQNWPQMQIKRRGKYKSTCYFGLELAKSEGVNSRKCSSRLQPGMTVSMSNGPPVVNAMDFIDESDRCAKYSKLKRSDEGQGQADEESEVSGVEVKVKVKQERSDFEEEESTEGPDHKVFCHSPDGSTPYNNVSELEKLILLHPGPFVTARIISRRFHRLVPSLDRAIHAMESLQSQGLGQVFTLKHGNSKVFFKAVPCGSLEKVLSVLGVRLTDYQAMFAERDSKLENTLHDRIKSFYPNLEQLSMFYKC